MISSDWQPDLSRLLEQVENNEEVILTPPFRRSPRKPGILAGQIRIEAGCFDQPEDVSSVALWW